MDFGDIILYLIILLPLVFKWIEKLLGKAADGGVMLETDDIDESEDGESTEEQDEEDVFRPVFMDVKPAAVTSEHDLPPVIKVEEKQDDNQRMANLPKEMLEGGYMSVREILENRKKKNCRQSALDSESNGKKGKIDPKKLVVYSEIMKTKF